MEYLPLSLLRDTCTVTINRKDDVHAKQRLGEFPKPFRWDVDPTVRDRFAFRTALVVSFSNPLR